MVQVYDTDGNQHGLYAVKPEDHEVFEAAVSTFFDSDYDDLEDWCNEEYSIDVERLIVDYEVNP